MTWNVCGYGPKAREVEAMFDEGELPRISARADIMFACETFQWRGRGGTVVALDFDGHVTSMLGVKEEGTT